MHNLINVLIFPTKRVFQESPAMLSCSTNNAYLDKTNLTCFTKNMNELCTKLKYTNYVIMYSKFLPQMNLTMVYSMLKFQVLPLISF